MLREPWTCIYVRMYVFVCVYICIHMYVLPGGTEEESRQRLSWSLREIEAHRPATIRTIRTMSRYVASVKIHGATVPKYLRVNIHVYIY